MEKEEREGERKKETEKKERNEKKRPLPLRRLYARPLAMLKPSCHKKTKKTVPRLT